MGTSYKTKQSVPEYAELLFKRQNYLTQQVMMNYEEDITTINQERIAQDEEQIHDACYLLVEYANREFEGKKMSILFRRRVKKSLDSCDESVKKLESTLAEVKEVIRE